MNSSISASSFPIHKLPHDLFDLVFFWLDDMTLLASSTVCKSWLPVAQTHLFRRRIVHVSPARAHEFCSLSIIPYIRKLALELEDDGELPPDDAHWLSDIVLPSFGAGLSAVTTLSISFVHQEETGDFTFPSSVGIIQRSFDQTRSLRLRYVNFLSPIQLAQCASSFPYLRSLSISLDCGRDFDYQPDTLDIAAMAELELASALNKLSIEFPIVGSCSMVQQALLNWMSHQSLSLKGLFVANVRRGLPLSTLREFVAASTLLKALVLDPIPVDSSSGLDLLSLVALSRLRLGPYSPRTVTDVTVADFICNTLRSIKKSSEPRIVINLPSFDLHPSGDAWDALDHEISTGKYRKVAFFSINRQCDPLRKCLQKSREAKKAYVKFYVPMYDVNSPFT